MNKPSLFVRRLRLFGVVLAAWFLTLFFATFTAPVALQKTNEKPNDPIGRYVYDVADPDMLNWLFLPAGLFAWLIGPIILIVLLVGVIVAKLRKDSQTSTPFST